MPSLRVMLLVQFVSLSGFFALAAVAGTHAHPNAPPAVCAGMLGVAGLAFQNAPRAALYSAAGISSLAFRAGVALAALVVVIVSP